MMGQKTKIKEKAVESKGARKGKNKGAKSLPKR